MNEPQLLAANVDVICIVTAFGSDFNLTRMTRYVDTVKQSGAIPVIVVNKSDLNDGLIGAAGQIEGIVPVVPVHLISARDRDSIFVFEQYFTGNRTVALLGSSGVGKSTLTNLLLGRDAQATQEVGGNDGRGRHTTTHRPTSAFEVLAPSRDGSIPLRSLRPHWTAADMSCQGTALGRARRTTSLPRAMHAEPPQTQPREWRPGPGCAIEVPQGSPRMRASVLGIIGGSGLYDLPGLQQAQWRKVETPWGEPSDDILFAELDGLPLRFLPRHGRGHRLSPSGINYCANIDAMKRAGVTDLVSVSACGSLREEFPPGHFVLVDQFIDRTFAREKSFFGTGLVAHVSLADPVSPGLVGLIEKAAKAEAIAHTRGGTYLVMEGPQFSTRAESHMYRAWGCSVIGMTNMPEAKLAREAEICYATIAMVTDFDCWRSATADVDVAEIIRVMTANAARAQALVTRLARDFPRVHPACPIGSDRSLDVALITAPEKRDTAMLAKNSAILARVLGRTGA